MIFDTHVQLNDQAFQDDLDSYIKSAENAGVKAFLCVGYDIESSKKAIEIAHKYPNVYAAIGMHPTELKDTSIDYVSEIEKLIDDRVVAIGEIGLDYHWDNVDRETQKKYFEYFIKLACKHKLPISLHVRDAIEDCYNILKGNKEYLTKGVMHCYSGSAEMMPKFIELGMYIALGGTVTFLNAKKVHEVAAKVPLDKLVVETDAPYLAPHPFRGQLNKPEYITKVVEKIGAIRDLSTFLVEEKTYENAVELFNIKD